jgi:hypothetical protein
MQTKISGAFVDILDMQTREVTDGSDCAARLEGLLERAQEFDPTDLFKKTAEISRQMGVHQAERLLEERPHLYAYSPVLTKGFYEFAVTAENAEVSRIRSLVINPPVSFHSVMSENLRSPYDRVAAIFDWLDFSTCRRFVMIGCGQIPMTALHVHDRTDVPEIVCVDIRTEAAADVNWLAQKLGADRISALASDGKEFDFHDADIVYVANMVRGKDAVVRQVLATAPENVRIVVRAPVALGRLWTEAPQDFGGLGLRVAEAGPVSNNQSRDLLLAPVPANQQ